MKVHTAKMHTKTSETQTKIFEVPSNDCEKCDYTGKNNS